MSTIELSIHEVLALQEMGTNHQYADAFLDVQLIISNDFETKNDEN
ncbi:hypothetical protein QN379_23435 [Glaciimonas sp. Gout2]|nr:MULTISPECIES: hypothetical protein [unclassified Glaciimonas]MEB0011466.1 hypothetical protein [Glaciimonas sp. Cout2]MEB0084962.1 hypothetical protein [Glaciimonas sp. Gout2]